MSKESASAKKKLGLNDWAFLALFGLAVHLVVQKVLERKQRAPELVFDETVLSEPNPFVADIRALTQVVQQRYAYLKLREETDDLDLEKLESSALAELESGEGELSFRQAILKYAAGLHDGHGYVEFEEHRLPSSRHWPFTCLLVAEGVMVDGIHPDAEGLLQRGDLVLGVNELDIDTYIAAKEMSITASSPGARRRQALHWLSNWADEEELLLRIERAGVGELEIALPCPLRRLKIPRPGRLSVERETSLPAAGIAYFRPGDFSAPVDSGFKEASPEEREQILAGSYRETENTFAGFAGARALILDLRGNPGGTDLLGHSLVSHLLEPGGTYLHLSSLQSGGWSEPSVMTYSEAKPEHAFGGKLVCLIDSGSFSTADNVAACLRDLHPDVTFLGEPTGAGSGAPRPFSLPRTGTKVTFCTMRVLSPNGHVIEGVGVSPDQKIERTREDVLAGRDTVLEAALKLLGE